MNSSVVSVLPDMPVREVARLMFEQRIGAVPVIEENGTLAGMIGEADLIGHGQERWWLKLAAEEVTAPALLEMLHPARPARDIMAAPPPALDPDTDIADIAGRLDQHGIERLPVVRNGRVIGMVSRGGLLRAVASSREPVKSEEPGMLGRVFASLDEKFQHHAQSEAPHPADTRNEAAERPATAEGFQQLAQESKREEMQHRQEMREAAEDRRQQETAELAERQLSEDKWDNLLNGARRAAESSQTEFLLLRFPSELCSDGGRAVNVPEPSWPETLRGEAAELYRRFEEELKPEGFDLAARVLGYIDGMPGDIGLFLTWGETPSEEAAG
ncbi:MAG: CBS domain-containing protein [Aliidongia sp.]